MRSKGAVISQGILRPIIAAMALALGATPLHAQQLSDVLYWDIAWTEYEIINAMPLDQSGLVRERRDLPIVINAPRETVFDIYSNVYNALGLHLYLNDIIAIHCDKYHFDFTAIEDVPLGPVVLPLKTVARQRFLRPYYYTSDTFDRPETITHQWITFQELSPTSTKVVEHLTFEALPLFIYTTVNDGVDAHKAVQEGLKAKIEAGEIPPVPYPDYVPIACH